MATKAVMQKEIDRLMVRLGERNSTLVLAEDQMVKLRDKYDAGIKHIEALECQRNAVNRENDELSQTIAIYEERLNEERVLKIELGVIRDERDDTLHELVETQQAVKVLSKLLTVERDPYYQPIGDRHG